MIKGPTRTRVGKGDYEAAEPPPVIEGKAARIVMTLEKSIAAVILICRLRDFSSALRRPARLCSLPGAAGLRISGSTVVREGYVGLHHAALREECAARLRSHSSMSARSKYFRPLIVMAFGNPSSQSCCQRQMVMSLMSP